MTKISYCQRKLSVSTYVPSKVYDANAFKEMRLLSLFDYCTSELAANKS